MVINRNRAVVKNIETVIAIEKCFCSKIAKDIKQTLWTYVCVYYMSVCVCVRKSTKSLEGILLNCKTKKKNLINFFVRSNKNVYYFVNFFLLNRILVLNLSFKNARAQMLHQQVSNPLPSLDMKRGVLRHISEKS